MDNNLLITKSLTELCNAYNEGAFVPLLESDVAGYFYHLLVKNNNDNASMIHLSARIKVEGEHRKYPDIVIGPVSSVPEQVEAYKNWIRSDKPDLSISSEKALQIVGSKGFAKQFRIHTAQIEVAIEIKPFLNSFKYQQLRSRARNAKKDIEALANQVKAPFKAILLFDEKGFLLKAPVDHSLKELLRLRDATDPSVKIIFISRDLDNKSIWQIE